MPAPTPVIAEFVQARLKALGQQVRAHRKALRISAVNAAQAAGMSRVTLHRIENGEPSVTMGAYFNAMAALGLDFGLRLPTAGGAATKAQEPERQDWIPARIRLDEYPQLKQLAWQVHGTDTLTPVEALNIYERNWRHLDLQAMPPHERQLVDALRLALGEGHSRV